MSPATTEDRTVLTATAYAERRGVTIQSVRAAIQSGRIAKAAVKNGRRWEIDAEFADELWRANTDERPRGNKPATNAPPPAAEWTDENEDEDLNDARLRHEKAKADLAEIKREQELGRLVSADKQRRDGFEVARLVRESMLQLADRLAPELTAEMDQNRLHDRLRREVIDSLRHLCAVDGGVKLRRGGSG